MKKLTFLLFVFLCVSSLCYAQQVPVPVSQIAQTPVETQAFTGKVDSVTIGDTAQGVKSEIVVVADQGQKLSFVVKSGTLITDKDAKMVALSDIKKDNKVAVAYTTSKMGTHKAQSIKLVE
ncbi:MAG: hypothetical protein NTX89_02325 [Candidatus Omnitrophica bacterium]|nr:hypothetical protein [Candidatus Omnitrophota bacterium]